MTTTNTPERPHRTLTKAQLKWAVPMLTGYVMAASFTTQDGLKRGQLQKSVRAEAEESRVPRATIQRRRDVLCAAGLITVAAPGRGSAAVVTVVSYDLLTSTESNWVPFNRTAWRKLEHCQPLDAPAAAEKWDAPERDPSDGNGHFEQKSGTLYDDVGRVSEDYRDAPERDSSDGNGHAGQKNETLSVPEVGPSSRTKKVQEDNNNTRCWDSHKQMPGIKAAMAKNRCVVPNSILHECVEVQETAHPGEGISRVVGKLAEIQLDDSVHDIGRMMGWFLRNPVQWKDSKVYPSGYKRPLSRDEESLDGLFSSVTSRTNSKT